MELAQTFLSHGPALPRTPVVISVPHAGRIYPAECAGLLRVAVERLLRLEDRYADLLSESCIKAGFHVIIAQVPRLWIDLNRDETDLDPTTMQLPWPSPPFVSRKARSGLGLVPTQLSGVGPLWRNRLDGASVAKRITTVHRPYHTALAQALESARARFGFAILLDLHSMPPLAGDDAPDIVVGDRFGRAASPRVSDIVRETCADAALRVVVNSPYAGGYILERHGRPQHNIHAVQLEVARALYLDSELAVPSAGLRAMQSLVLSCAMALAEAYGVSDALAAAE